MISDEIFEELESDKQVLARMKQSRVEMEQNRKAIQREIAQLGEKIHSLKKVEEDLTSTLWQKRKAITEVEKKVESKERDVIRYQKEKDIVARITRQGEILDLLTDNFTWRKDAKHHQLSGGKQLALAGRGILGDKRGLGKTLTSLLWLDMLSVKKSIIFVPKETATAFRKQMPRWAPHRPLFDLTSKSRAERNAVFSILPRLEKFNVLINVEAWRNDPTVLDKLIMLEAEAVIIDEAHVAKDENSLVFRGLRRVIYPDEFGGNGNTVKYVLPMTGTPFLNYPDEMWSLLYLVDREAWPTKLAYRQDYLEQTWEGKWKFAQTLQGNARDKLVERLGLRFVARDREAAGVEIPPQELVVHELEFNSELYPKQYQAYATLEAKAAMVMSDMTNQQVMGVEGLALLTRLRQMITWPKGIQLKDTDGRVVFECNIDESVKIDCAERLIKQLVHEGERVVLFSQFKAPLHELQRRLFADKVKSIVLDGSTTTPERERIKKDFDADEGSHIWDVVLCNYKVAGQSLDFTAANQMVILDEEWNPGRNEQAYGRIDRMGQTKKTTVHILRTPETVDMDMASLVDRKQDEIGAFEASVKEATRYLLSKAA